MFTYICADCGAVFEESRNDYHTYYGCPYCKGDAEPAEPCEVCKKLLPQSKAVYHRCEAHKAETLAKFRTFLAELTNGELEYLQDRTDGVYWSELKRERIEFQGF